MKLPLTVMVAAASVLMAAPNDVQQRLQESASVFTEIMHAPDKGIPQDLLEKAHCVVIVPGMKKGAFLVGGKYGKGFITCRRQAGWGWSAPGAVRIEGGSFGFQIGGSETDLVLLVMNKRGAEKLLKSQFTLGGEGTVAAGPVGRNSTAQTDAMMHAEILSWSRSRGVFAGISLEGATLRQDLDDNSHLYGREYTNRYLVDHRVKAPPSASRLLTLLDRYSPHHNVGRAGE